jgi:hypothetical protein
VNQPVLYVSNPDRDPRFAIATGIYREGERLVVRKSPLDARASDHVDGLAATFASLSAVAGLSDHLVLAEPRLVGGVAEFDYIDGRNAERELLELILADRRSEALAVLDRLHSVIDVLPTTTMNPTAQESYVEVFGRTYDRVERCARHGVVDLNLDNVIITPQGQWQLIDYEWAFPFAVPKRYLVQRFLFWFFCARYREALRYHAQRIDSVWIAEGICVPTYLHERFTGYFADLDEAVAAESALQNHVMSIPSSLPRIHFFDPPVPATDDRGHLGLAAILEERRALAERAEQLDQQLAVRAAEHERVTAALAAELAAVRADRELILQSRAFRLARLLGRARFWR